MSVVVVVRKGDKAVIAADTLYGFGRGAQVHHDYASGRSKLVAVPGGFAGSVGSSAHQHVLRSLVRRHSDKLDFSSVDAIFETLLVLQPILRDEYYVRMDEDDESQEYDSNQLDLLLCTAHGIFGALSYREVCAYDRFWAHGSGSLAALGALHALYDRLDDPEMIALGAVEAACRFDDACGLPVHSHTVTLTSQ